jgi:hypothetical protein
MEDFTRAISEIKPAFGVSVDALNMCMPNGIYIYIYVHFLLFGVSVDAWNMCMPNGVYICFFYFFIVRRVCGCVEHVHA